MKKLSVLLSAAVAFAALVSCNKEISNPSENRPSEGNVPFVLNAQIPETKLALGDDWSLTWEEGDVIYAVTTDEEWGVAYTKDNTTDSIADFEYDGANFTTTKTISDGEHTFNFLYAPESQKSYHRGASTTYSVPAVQQQDCSDPTANVKAYYPLAGQVTVNTPATDINSKMSHLATIVKVTLKNRTENDLDIASFKILMPSSKVTGIYAVSFGENPSMQEQTSKKYGDAVTVTLTNGSVAAGAELPVYVVMAPLVNYSGDITFVAEDTDGNKYTKTNAVSNVTFEAGSYNTANFSLKPIVADESEITVTKTMNEVVTDNDFTVSSGSNVTCYTSFSLDDVVTVSTTGSANCGSFWTGGNGVTDWRLYQNKNGNVIISLANGYELVSLTLTYTNLNTGILAGGPASGVTVPVSDSSVSYSVANSGTATNGQIRISEISVVYKPAEAAPVYTITVPSSLIGGTVVSNLTEATEGTPVTVTATPVEGYLLKSLTAGVSGESLNGNVLSFVMPAENVNVSASFEAIPQVDANVDVITPSFTGITNTTYADFENKQGTSGAVYAGNCAGGNSSVQLRSRNNNSGIVSTTSGGKVAKVEVVWNSNTATGRTLNVYGKSSAYTSASDLYSETTQGVLLGTIVYGASTVLTIDGDYEFIGLRSNADAMYLTSISITWAD